MLISPMLGMTIGAFCNITLVERERCCAAFGCTLGEPRQGPFQSHCTVTIAERGITSGHLGWGCDFSFGLKLGENLSAVFNFSGQPLTWESDIGSMLDECSMKVSPIIHTFIMHNKGQHKPL